jgi:hypothetical protein
MDRPEDDQVVDATPDETSDAPDGADVEGHNFEFYRQEARSRAAEAEAHAKAAARSKEARSKSDEKGRR